MTDLKMEDESNGISSQLHLSLQDLSMELTQLGLEPLSQNDCNKPSEVCETLLSAAWSLINLVHCSALGLNESKDTLSGKDVALLNNENKALELKLTQLRNELAVKDDALAHEKVKVKTLDREQSLLSQTFLKQKNMLLATLETQENHFKHEISRYEVQCEQFREMVRKSLGASVKANSVVADKLGDALQVLTVSNNRTSVEQQELVQTALNRLKAANQTLVTENLLLRDALQSIHVDIHNMFEAARKSHKYDSELQENYFTENIFKLPLEYNKNKIKEIRHHQVRKLYTICNLTQTN